MSRSIQKHVAAVSLTNAVPPPPLTLTAAEAKYYAGVMESVPSSIHHSEPVKALAAAVAMAMAEIEEASALIKRDGLVVDGKHGLKANPAVQLRDTASKRLAQLLSRLKALPVGDIREQHRQSRFEAIHRPRSPVLDLAASTNGAEPDWLAMLSKE